MKFSVSLWRPENVHGFSILGCGNLSWDWANVYYCYYVGICSGYYYILVGPASATGWCSKNYGISAGYLSSTLSLLLLSILEFTPKLVGTPLLDVCVN